MESKEINKSESTLTQGTMSRTAFTSNRISLLSFSLPRDFLHDVFRCTFCTFYFFFCLDFFAFQFFFAGMFCFHLFLSVFLFETHMPASWASSDEENRNFSPLKMTTERCININYDIFLKFAAMLKITGCLKSIS
jgi:hypothetical protein